MKKDKRTLLTVAGAAAGLLAAGLRTRLLEIEETNVAPAGITKLSRNDWKNVLLRTKDALGEKNLSALAAGVAYYTTLAFFPLLAAAVAIAALLISPEQLEDLLSVTRAYLPADISSIIASQFENLVERRTDNILAATLAIALALYGASGASKSLVLASNVVYGKKETRGWILQQLIGVAWTVVGIILGFIVLALIAVNRSFLLSVAIPDVVVPFLLYGRWVIVLFITISGLALFYRYGPNRHGVKLRWVILGAILATAAWLGATGLFFTYLQSFANYTQSYSLFAGIIALMVWMNLSALILLIGAEINHQLEIISRQK